MTAEAVPLEGLDWNHWAMAGEAATGQVSFSAPGAEPGEAGPPESPVWTLDLPSDPIAAMEKLDAMQRSLQAAEEVLEAVPARLEALGNQAAGEAGGGVSFEAASALPPAESELLAALRQIEAGPQPVQYGLLPFEGFNLREAQAQFLSAQQKLLQMFAYLAWVETRQEGTLVGRTAVAWSGDANTLYRDGVTQEQVELHRRNLDLALKSRLTLLHTLTISASGAAKIAVLVTTPGGALLALPAVWKYVNQLLKELRG